jgi:hypothetical protein
MLMFGRFGYLYVSCQVVWLLGYLTVTFSLSKSFDKYVLNLLCFNGN